MDPFFSTVSDLKDVENVTDEKKDESENILSLDNDGSKEVTCEEKTDSGSDVEV